MMNIMMKRGPAAGAHYRSNTGMRICRRLHMHVHMIINIVQVAPGPIARLAIASAHDAYACSRCRATFKCVVSTS